MENKMDIASGSAGEREDSFTRAIETHTAKIPSSVYLGAAIASIGASALLKTLGRDDWADFVGHWAPTILILGLYNKMVKQHGPDKFSRAA